MRIDFQAHHYPREYVNALKHNSRRPRIRVGRAGAPLLEVDDRTSFPLHGGLLDLQHSLQTMKASGVGMQVLSVPVPGTDLFEESLATKVSKLVNDEFSTIQAKDPEHFACLANVPLAYPEAAVQELDRAVSDLGLKGVLIYSNVAGRLLDSEEFWPFYARAEKLGVPIMIHPTAPLSTVGLEDYGLISAVGFLFDTTLAMLRIICSGVLDRYPELRFVLPHVGSTLPYIIGRIDWEVGNNRSVIISKKPSEYLSKIYVDTVSHHGPALECAYKTLSHDRILFGSDYPFRDLSEAVADIQQLDIPDEDKERIFRRNAMALLKFR